MPTYEYRCSNCGELTEAFQKMSDAPLTTCPHCGHESLKRLVSGGAGVIYKGEGWYVTDYSKKSSGGKDIDSKTTSNASSKSSSKSDSASSSPSKTDTPSTGGSAEGGGGSTNASGSTTKADA